MIDLCGRIAHRTDAENLYLRELRRANRDRLRAYRDALRIARASGDTCAASWAMQDTRMIVGKLQRLRRKRAACSARTTSGGVPVTV